MFNKYSYKITWILINKVNCKILKVYDKKVVTSLRAGQASAAKTAHYSVLPKLEKVFTAFFSIYSHFGLCTAAASVLRSSVLKKSSERRRGFLLHRSGGLSFQLSLFFISQLLEKNAYDIA